ncbi:MAG TPA: hypothetical protein DCY88_07370, partial [Cyanobacteria bacterium UBA11372]|nr:hypothetical protein [Cyanobacteria bacterium UBA11372]
NELFGGFGRQRVVPRQQQESEVSPVAANLPVPTSAAPQNDRELTASAVLNLLFPEFKAQGWPFTSSAVKFLSTLESPPPELPQFRGHH